MDARASDGDHRHLGCSSFALTFPLNRMVGRTFVPNEDMGEFTVHIDTPQGTSLEGTTEIARSIVKEIGEQEGVSHVSYLSGADRYTHFHVFFYLLPPNERKVTQDEVIARVRRILAKHPGNNPTVTPRNPLGGGGAGGGGNSINASLLGPDIDKLYDYSQQLLEKAQADAEPRRLEDRLQQRQPRGAGGGRPRARRGSRRPHGDGRQHAASDGGGRRRDFDAIAKRASSIR